MGFESITNAKQLSRFILKSLTIPVSESELKSISYLVMHDLFQLNHTDIITEKSISLDGNLKTLLENVLFRLNQREPVQYVLGKTEFYGLEIKVSPATLIPRPETEELVDWVVKENPEPQLKVLDIGTGSGCIAVALQKFLKKATVYALDVSLPALEIARENAIKHHAPVQFFHLDIMESLPLLPEFDIIVSNPPYVLEKEKKFMHENVLNHEPPQALFVPDHSPLIFYDRIVELTKILLKNGGKLYLEINENFGNEIVRIMEGSKFAQATALKDIRNKTRFVKGIKI